MAAKEGNSVRVEYKMDDESRITITILSLLFSAITLGLLAAAINPFANNNTTPASYVAFSFGWVVAPAAATFLLADFSAESVRSTGAFVFFLSIPLLMISRILIF